MKSKLLMTVCLLILAVPLIAQDAEQRNNKLPDDYYDITLPPFSPFAGTNRDSCDCIELMFVIDVTGSMAGAINNIKTGLADILNLADDLSCGNLRAGVVAFRDDVQVLQTLTPNMTDVISALNTISAYGGTGWAEASDQALHELSSTAACLTAGDFDPSDWTTECCKVAILVTDAPPAGCDDNYAVGTDDVSAQTVATDLANMGVHIGSLLVLGDVYPDPDAQPLMINYATVTDGMYGEVLPNGSGTSAAIEQVILNCQGQSTETELCCFSTGCTTVLTGQCEPAGGMIVTNCDNCEIVHTETTSWGSVKALYR